jgi:antitoxin component YwqK of YwqJK toxin-antitoxin module
LRKASAFLPLILALLPAIMCSGEDRVELIKGANGSKELVYRNDALAEERSYDAGGGLLGEKSFGADSLPTGTRSYIREEGRLVRVEARDASGVIIGSMEYHYDRDGMLLGVTADGSLGDGAAGMVSSGGTPHNSWTEAGSATTVLGYDESGRVAVIQTTRDGKSISLERRTYGEGGILSSVVTEDSASGSSSELLYDENGRQSQRRDIPARGPEAKTLYRYDESGHLLEETRRVGMHTTSIKRAYAEDGTLSRTETRLDGELLLTVENIENGRVEELYDDGAIFVKATYIGGRKVKDEFYSEGALLRSRDYQ